MITRESVFERRKEILDVARKYGAHDVRIFGSIARSDATESSDLDLIVRFDPDRSLLDHGGLLMALQELLHIKVDVIDEGGLRPRFRQIVMKEAIPL